MKKKKQFVLYSYQNYMKLFFFSPLTSDRANELNFRPVYLENNTLYYRYRFPILFWEKKDKTKIPTLFCELSINTTNNSVRVDVVKPSNESYAYFYCTEVTINNKNSHSMLINIHQNIRNKLKKLNIKSITEKNNHKKGGNNDNTPRIQKTRKSKMGNSIPNKQIQRRNTGNRYTSKRRKFSGKMLQN